jgi:FMN-dependent NADH-azoreductase
MFGVGIGIKIGGNTIISSSYDADAQAFFDRVTTAGGTLSTTEKNATNQLVLDLKSAGIWTSMQAIYPMVGASASACAQNLKSSSFMGTFSSGWTFASTGVTPNGTSAYMTTGFIPSTNLTATSQSSSIYSRSNTNNGASLNADFSAVSTGIGAFVVNVGTNIAGINGFTRYGNAQDVRILVAQRKDGFFIGSRTSSTLIKLYRDNVILGTTTTAETGICNIAPYIAAENTNGTATGFSNREYAFAHAGDGLSDTQASNFYTAVQIFQTTLNRNVGAQIVSDADAQAYINRVYAAGGTLTNTEATAVNQLTIDMKASNVWTSMKAIYPMIGSSASSCAQNLKSSSFTGTFTSGWTFASTGATPNGTSAYFDTTLNPSTNLTQNNASFSVYSRTNSDGIRCDIGCTDSGGAVRLISIYAKQSNNINADINSTTSRISVANLNSTGFYLTRRTANNIFKLDKNGINIGNNTTTDIIVMPNFNLYLAGIPFFSQFSNRENSFASIGDGLTDTQASNLYTAVQTFNTTLSRQV